MITKLPNLHFSICRKTAKAAPAKAKTPAKSPAKTPPKAKTSVNTEAIVR